MKTAGHSEAIHAFALTLAAACACVLTAIARAIPRHSTLVQVDTKVADWMIAHHTSVLDTIFTIVSIVGAPVLIVLLMSFALVLLVRRAWSWLILLLATWSVNQWLDVFLKQLFRRPRPPFAIHFGDQSFGFPSGHAMDSLIGYGLMAYLIGECFPELRAHALWSAGILVAAIGLARIYLAVHYTSDVVAGFAVGIIWLAVCVSAHREWRHHRAWTLDRRAHRDTRENVSPPARGSQNTAPEMQDVTRQP